MTARRAKLSRATNETRIDLTLDLDGGPITIATGVDFFDHMLHAFAKHSACGLVISAHGDGMDHHHVIEDVGILLGRAVAQALGEKTGIARYGSMMVPLDDALIAASVDLSGRAYLNFRVSFLRDDLGELPTEMVGEFFRAVTEHGKFNLHLVQMNGHVAHHVCEATFKAFAKAFAMAIAQTGRPGDVPSTKGMLE